MFKSVRDFFPFPNKMVPGQLMIQEGAPSQHERASLILSRAMLE